MKYLFFIFLFISASKVFAQDGRALTTQAMYEDFDNLVHHIQTVSPHIPIKKDLWHYDALKQIAGLRKNIDTIHSDLSFEVLINRVLNSCQDYHTGVMAQSDSYRKISSLTKLYLPIAYVDGSYLIAKSFTNEGQAIPVGSVITHINHQKADTYVNKLKTELVLRYDLVEKKFYAENFYQNMQTVFDGSFSLTLYSPDGRVLETHISNRKRADFVQPIKDSIKNQVTYWPDKQALYIKIFRMDEALVPYFQRKIVQYRNSAQPIKKIIIDVRDNNGGSDRVWQSVYAAILPRKTVYPLTIDGFDPRFMSAGYLKDKAINPDSIQKNNSLLLKKYDLHHYINRDWLIIPTDTSLNFTGKIVVVGNENIYSAGASVMLLPNAWNNDQIYSVGRKTGMFLGGGYSPMIFELPHAKIQYRIEPALEVTNVSKLPDLMHDDYEYTIPYTLEELYNKEKYNGNTLGDIYLKTFDPFIRKALEL
jgi:hypothetical protein